MYISSNRFMSSSNLSPDSLTAVLLSSMHRLETVEPTEYTSVLQDSLTHHKISVPKLQNQVTSINNFIDSLKTGIYGLNCYNVALIAYPFFQILIYLFSIAYQL